MYVFLGYYFSVPIAHFICNHLQSFIFEQNILPYLSEQKQGSYT